MKPLYNYLTFNKKIVDIDDYDEDVLSIFSSDALEMIKNGESNWEDMVPTFVDQIIKEKCLFGYCGVKPTNKSSEDPAEAAAKAIEQGKLD